MSLTWNRSTVPMSAPHPRIAVSPRGKPTPEPGPFDGRNVWRAMRLAVGLVVCEVRGHRWGTPYIRVGRFWDGRRGRYTESKVITRRCERCELSRTRLDDRRWNQSMRGR